MKRHTGIILDNIIEQSNDPGLPDGENVEIPVTATKLKWRAGEGLKRCAGAVADHWTDDDDQILAAMQRIVEMPFIASWRNDPTFGYEHLLRLLQAHRMMDAACRRIVDSDDAPGAFRRSQPPIAR